MTNNGPNVSALFGWGRVTMAVSSVLALTTLLPGSIGLAQEQATGPMEEVVTIGSRGTIQRTATQTAVPVSVISNEEILRSGITETARLLQFLAPSFNFSTSTISDGTDIVRPATLRGLAPDQTLVLVNGKRYHNSALMHVNGSIGRGTAGVDLNSIPPSAIQRIEILRDGASSQYGSDAIAGVINIILKDQAGFDFLVYGGETFGGDGSQTNLSATGGIEIGNRGFFNYAVEYRDRSATNRSGVDNRQQFNFLEQVMGQADLQRDLPTDDMGNLVPADNDGDPYCQPGAGDPGFGDPNLGQFTLTTCTSDPREATFNRQNHRYGDPDSENIYLYVNSAVPFGESAEFYFFGGVAQRDGESGGFYRRAEDARTVLAIHPEGFLPLITTNVDDGTLTAGIRTDLGQWTLDTSLTTGGNEFEFIIQNSNNVTLGAASPTTANAGSLEFAQTTVNWDMVRGLDLGGMLSTDLAVGAEYRVDSYKILPGDFASWANGPDDDPATALPTQFGGVAAPGIQVFPGFRTDNAVDERRDSIGVYGEIDMMPGDRSLFAAALRFEDYSDFGNTLNGKVAGRYDVSPLIGLRGSLETGFRAPSLHQQWFNNTSTQFVTVMGVPNTPVEVGTFNNTSDVVREGFQVGPLNEETSVSLGLGITFSGENWDFTADYYHIEIQDRIVISGRFSAETEDAMGNPCVIGTGNCPIADILAPFPGVSAAQFFSNAIDTKTDGLDLVGQWTRLLAAGGQLQLTGSAAFNKTELDGPVKTPDSLTNAVGADQTLFSRQEQIWLEDGQPRQHINLAVKYGLGPFSVLVRGNYFGEVKSTEDASDPSTDQTFGAKTLIDVNLQWDFPFGLTLNGGAINITDETPDQNIPGNSFGGIFPFNRRTTPFGFNGGMWYLRATYFLEGRR